MRSSPGRARRGPVAAARGYGVPASSRRGFGAQPHLTMPRLLREPLVHFLLAGGALFLLSALFGQSFGVGGNRNRIEVTADRIQQLRETWTRQRGAPPTRRELDSLIEDFIREEVLYREAVASGLDQGDTIVRRRLAQKVEFLAQSVASTVEPSDAELQAFFDDNAERYRVPDQVGFSHVYFSGSNRGASAEAAARGALARLTSGEVAAAEAAQLGDRFMLQYEYPPQSRDQIRDLFGPRFAGRLFELPVDEWSGPVPSSFGLHVVRIRQRVPSRLPALREVRGQVARDLGEQRLRSAADAYYEGLRRRFEIVMDAEALAGG